MSILVSIQQIVVARGIGKLDGQEIKKDKEEEN